MVFGDAADGFAESVFCFFGVACLLEGVGEFDLEVGVEELFGLGVFGIFGERFGLAEELGSFLGVAIAEGGDGEAGDDGGVVGVVEACFF